MITYRNLGKWGNLGNQLFQVAAILGLSKRFGHEALLPEWKYSHFFQKEVPQSKDFVPVDAFLKESNYHFDLFDWADLNDKTKRFDISGWLQSEKFWEHSKEAVMSHFTFTSIFDEMIRPKFAHILDKPTIAISVRQGDYVGNQNYELLPINYYGLALIKHFPDWRDYNIFVFSDDIEWCRVHFQCLPNVHFATGQSDIEQLYLMSECTHFLVANSTFSWWGAYLGEWKNKQKGITSTVVRPLHYFDGPLLINSTKDHWPESWVSFDHKGKKFNMKDVTFTMPIYHDSNERRENLMLNLCLLQKDIDTHIILGEQGTDYFRDKTNVSYYFFNEMTEFHRTKMLNEMAKMATTDIIVNYDVDVSISPLQLWMSAEKIRRGEAGMVYPYDGRFARVKRDPWFKKLESRLDVGIFRDEPFDGKYMNSAASVGGAVMFDKNIFISGGMENEYMINYGPEDTERYERFGRLGYKVVRTPGILFHMDHVIVEGTWIDNPHFQKNNAELEKQRNMDVDQLEDYVKSWPWTQVYTPDYYEAIYPGSITSAETIFDRIQEHISDVRTVLDVGGGIGQWGKGIGEKYDYTLIDYRIPIDMLLVPKDRYIEFDIRRDKKFIPLTYDLVICTEVMEHIDEKYAKEIISFLCARGKKVLFSAAIPGQGGNDHKNEQWQSYWASLFKENGYHPIVIRDKLVDEKDIELWYQNNIVLYVPWKTDEYVEDFILPDLYINIIGTHTQWEKIKKRKAPISEGSPSKSTITINV